MRRRLRVPVWLQVGVVLALLVSSSATLWRAGEALVVRDRRRAEAARRLGEAEAVLAERGAAMLVYVPEWPETLDPDQWRALDAWLAESSRAAPGDFPGVESGFYVPSADRFLGRSGPGARGDDASPRPSSEPPARERALIEAQIRQSLDGDRPLSIVVDVPPHSLALRTAPLWVNGRQVAAIWTLVRLDEGAPVASSIRGYRVAAGLAIGGVVLALVLSLGLWATVRRQGRDRERLQAELRRSERLAALGKLLAGVAHEVRNPLAGIRSTAQLWQRGLAPDAEGLADLVAEVDRLDGLVARLLQFSRADAQALAPGDLNAVASEAARLARPQAEAQGVAVALDLAPGPLTARLSPPALLQVLRNLTTNALQAMPDGGVLRVATRRDPSTGAIEARVGDTGPGLSVDVAAHLFEPFFTTRPDGTGLGLAIAREIALAHGGDLRAENGRDRGGCLFTLSLPPTREAPDRPGRVPALLGSGLDGPETGDGSRGEP